MKHDSRIVLYSTEPDPLETRVRAVCGAVLWGNHFWHTLLRALRWW